MEPFTVWVFDDSGRPVQFQLDVPDLPAKHVSERWPFDPLWRSVSIVALDHGFLRTFSDLRSDARMLVLYDGTGKVVRQLPLGVPFGIIESTPGERLLIAARTGERMEVVTYRWRWEN